MPTFSLNFKKPFPSVCCDAIKSIHFYWYFRTCLFCLFCVFSEQQFWKQLPSPQFSTTPLFSPQFSRGAAGLATKTKLAQTFLSDLKFPTVQNMLFVGRRSTKSTFMVPLNSLKLISAFSLQLKSIAIFHRRIFSLKVAFKRCTHSLFNVFFLCILTAGDVACLSILTR